MTPVRIFDGPAAVAAAAADELVRIARDAVAARGSCSVALSGGSTPKRLFEVLAARGRGELPWGQVELWWGDERTVAPDHADSNYRLAREHLIEPLRLDPARVHRMRGELADHAAAARAYEEAMVAALGAPPVFDLVLLGMGPDGHTASLFPGSPAVSIRDASGASSLSGRWVVANPVTSPPAPGTTTRLTLTAPAINAAREVRFVVAGADKAAALAAVLEGPRDPERYPAQLIAPASWLVDEAAAAQLAARSGAAAIGGRS